MRCEFLPRTWRAASHSSSIYLPVPTSLHLNHPGGWTPLLTIRTPPRPQQRRARRLRRHRRQVMGRGRVPTVLREAVAEQQHQQQAAFRAREYAPRGRPVPQRRRQRLPRPQRGHHGVDRKPRRDCVRLFPTSPRPGQSRQRQTKTHAQLRPATLRNPPPVPCIVSIQFPYLVS